MGALRVAQLHNNAAAASTKPAFFVAVMYFTDQAKDH